MTKILKAAVVIVALCLSLAGCGGHSSKASNSSGNTTPTTVGAPTTTSPTTAVVNNDDAAAVQASVNASLNDLNGDLSAIDSAPSDEGDPSQ